MKNKLITKLFTVFIVLYSLLYIYASPIESLSIADVILILFWAILIFVTIKNNFLLKVSLPAMFILFITLLNLFILIIFFKQDARIILFPTLRMSAYIFTIAIFIRNYFDIELGKKSIIIISFISSLYLLIQLIISNLFHYYLPGTLPLPLLSEDLSQYNLLMSIDYNYYDRVRSFFVEPSHYAIYNILGLFYALYNNNKKNIVFIIVITLGLILSGSSTAIIMVPFIYIISFCKDIRKMSKEKIIKLFFAILFIIMLLFVYIGSEKFEHFYNRTFVDKHAVNDRFDNYERIFNYNEENMYLEFLGHGYNKPDFYIPSVPRIYWYYGILGIAFYMIYSLQRIIVLKGANKYVFVILFILSFASDLLLGQFALVYFAFILNDNTIVEEKIKNEPTKTC